MAAPGQPLHDLAGVGLLDSGEQRDASEPLLAEHQEREQARAGPGAQGIIDQRALQVEREYPNTQACLRVRRRTGESASDQQPRTPGVLCPSPAPGCGGGGQTWPTWPT